MDKAFFKIDGTSEMIPVHFNPSEYSIVTDTVTTSGDTNNLPYQKNERLSMQLTFDTYTNVGGKWGENPVISTREDVRAYTGKISSLVIKDNKKPIVTFTWGSLNFRGVVVSVSQKFTMFLDDGKPVRAVLDVVMQGVDINEVKQADAKSINWVDNDWKKNLQIAKARTLLESKI